MELTKLRSQPARVVLDTSADSPFRKAVTETADALSFRLRHPQSTTPPLSFFEIEIDNEKVVVEVVRFSCGTHMVLSVLLRVTSRSEQDGTRFVAVTKAWEGWNVEQEVWMANGAATIVTDHQPYMLKS